MKSLFDLENPFIQFLARVGDMILANALFIICSLPVVTCGAALCALHKVNQKIVSGELTGLWRTFFRGFRENFRQATVSWVLLLVYFLGMSCNLLLVAAYLTGTPALICRWILYVLMAAMAAVSGCLFPLIARYENTLREHVRNAGVLAVVKLPRALLIAFLNILPLVIAYFSVSTFIGTLVFWMTIGFSFVSYIASTLLAPVFQELEQADGPNVSLFK